MITSDGDELIREMITLQEPGANFGVSGSNTTQLAINQTIRFVEIQRIERLEFVRNRDREHRSPNVVNQSCRKLFALQAQTKQTVETGVDDAGKEAVFA